MVTGDSRYEKALAIRERGESVDQALENWWQFKTKNALAEAEARTVRILSDLVDDGSISIATAAEKAEMTEQGFLEAAKAAKEKKAIAQV